MVCTAIYAGMDVVGRSVTSVTGSLIRHFKPQSFLLRGSVEIVRSGAGKMMYFKMYFPDPKRAIWSARMSGPGE